MPVIKTGRTHLQDATPVRSGTGVRGLRRPDRARQGAAGGRDRELGEVALGGTAVGTGINTHAEFARASRRDRASERASARSPRRTNHFQAQSTLDGVVAASGALKTIAVSLLKIANDIRWLGSGPRAGIGEIDLPAVQPGSSIMPGKVNPVIAESVAMVAAQVLGNDVTINIAGQSGNFELNVMMPVAAYNLLQSIALLANAAENFAAQASRALKATEQGPRMVEQGLMLGTALAPRHRLRQAADIAKAAAKSGPDHPRGRPRRDRPLRGRAEQATRPRKMTQI